MSETKGFKTFNYNRTNRYGMLFEEGKIYSVSKPPKFGTKGVGFHFCSRLEDTLTYFPAMEEEVSIAKVTALGDLAEKADDNYEYYDLYSTNKIRIDKFLTREEILKMYLMNPERQNEDRVRRFLQGFRLTPREIEMFRWAYGSNERIQKTLAYYQEGKKDVFTEVESYQKRLKGN